MGIQTTWDAVNQDTDGNSVSATVRYDYRDESSDSGFSANTSNDRSSRQYTISDADEPDYGETFQAHISAVASGYLDSAELDIAVLTINRPPHFRVSENGADTSSYAFATAQDAQNIEFPVFARDEDLNSIVYSLSGEPMGWDAGGSRALGNITFTPGGGIQSLVPGTINFDVRVRDEHGETHTASVAVTVTGADNEAPIASNNRDFQVTEGQSMTFNLDGFFSDDGGTQTSVMLLRVLPKESWLRRPRSAEAISRSTPVTQTLESTTSRSGRPTPRACPILRRAGRSRWAPKI